MITKEQIVKLGATPIEDWKEGEKEYSPVLLKPKGAFSLKNKSGNLEFIWAEGEVFFHWDGKDFFVRQMDQDIDLLTELINT